MINYHIDISLQLTLILMIFIFSNYYIQIIKCIISIKNVLYSMKSQWSHNYYNIIIIQNSNLIKTNLFKRQT